MPFPPGAPVVSAKVVHPNICDLLQMTDQIDYTNPSFSSMASGEGSLPRKAIYAASVSIEPPEE